MRNFRLYVIVDRAACGRRDILKVANDAVNGGADIIQLRDKNATTLELIKVARQMMIIAHRKHVPLIINDRADVAYAVDADGVHLGQDDLPLKVARAILGRRKTIGISTHNIRQALQAQRDGADYIGVGPVYQTPTKPGYKPAGLKLVGEVAARIKIPFVAIGGIDPNTVHYALRAGATRVAVVRAVTGARDVKAAARRLKRMLIDWAK
jgi:thiamine-phosphate pyrophosphorylase